MPFFPSLQRPAEQVDGLPGTISAGAVSTVQLYDLKREVMRTVVVLGGSDGAVYAMGAVEDKASSSSSVSSSAPGLLADAPIGGALLISADVTCGPLQSPPAASSTTAAPAPGGQTAAPAAALAPARPWRLQSVVAYRASYNEAIVIVARIPNPNAHHPAAATAAASSPTAPTEGGAAAAEYCSELLFFYTQPLHSLSCFGAAGSFLSNGGRSPSTNADGSAAGYAENSTTKSVLAARVTRPREHIVRLFALHVEPSATGSRLHAPAAFAGHHSGGDDPLLPASSAVADEQQQRALGLGAIRYAHQSPAGLTVLCSSAVLEGEGASARQTAVLSALCLPPSAATRFKNADLVRPLHTLEPQVPPPTSNEKGGASSCEHDAADPSASAAAPQPLPLSIGHGHVLPAVWADVGRAIRQEDGASYGLCCALAVTCSAAPEPRACPSSVGWMVAAGCTDGTVLLARCGAIGGSAEPHASASSLGTSSHSSTITGTVITRLARFMGPTSWLQFFSNRAIQRRGDAAVGSSSLLSGTTTDVTRSAALDKFLPSTAAADDATADGHCGEGGSGGATALFAAPPPLPAPLHQSREAASSAGFSPQLCLLGLDVSGRALQWTALCAAKPTASYVLDAVEAPPQPDLGSAPVSGSTDDPAVGGDAHTATTVAIGGGTARGGAVPAETPEKRRKDKSLVERWLNRKGTSSSGAAAGGSGRSAGGGGPSALAGAGGSQMDLLATSQNECDVLSPTQQQQQHGGQPHSSAARLSEEDSGTYTTTPFAGGGAEQTSLRLSVGGNSVGGGPQEHPLTTTNGRRCFAQTLRDLSHVHSNSARLRVLAPSGGSNLGLGGNGRVLVGSVIGRGPLAAAFVDHCFEEESYTNGPQLLISTLGRVVAFCAPYGERSGGGGAVQQQRHPSQLSIGNAPSHQRGGGGGVAVAAKAALTSTSTRPTAASVISSVGASSVPPSHRNFNMSAQQGQGGGAAASGGGGGGGGPSFASSSVMGASPSGAVVNGSLPQPQETPLPSARRFEETATSAAATAVVGPSISSPRHSPVDAADLAPSCKGVASGGSPLAAPALPPRPLPVLGSSPVGGASYDTDGGRQSPHVGGAATLSSPLQQQQQPPHPSAQQQQPPLAVVDYFDVFSPMLYLGLADFSGVGDSVVVMASVDHVAVMPLHDRPAAAALSERLEAVRRLLGLC